jgi:hypothetical protein
MNSSEEFNDFDGDEGRWKKCHTRKERKLYGKNRSMHVDIYSTYVNWALVALPLQ